jgi:DNA-binding IscR family transcriptional regulator
MVMRDVRDEMARILDHTSLADVCRREDQARSDASQSEEPMYFI